MPPGKVFYSDLCKYDIKKEPSHDLFVRGTKRCRSCRGHLGKVVGFCWGMLLMKLSQGAVILRDCNTVLAAHLLCKKSWVLWIFSPKWSNWRLKVQNSMPPVPRDKNDISRTLQAFVRPHLSWKDWQKKHCDLKKLLKLPKSRLERLFESTDVCCCVQGSSRHLHQSFDAQTSHVFRITRHSLSCQVLRAWHLDMLL